ETVHLRTRQRRHEALEEGAVGLVDESSRLRRDGAEDERALAGPGDPGEDREAPLGDLDADVLEVVLPRALDADEVMAVGRVLGHRLSRSGGGQPSDPTRSPAGPGWRAVR